MLHVVHDQNVALAESDNPVAHVEVALALHGDKDLKPLMPVGAQAARVGWKCEGFDG